MATVPQYGLQRDNTNSRVALNYAGTRRLHVDANGVEINGTLHGASTAGTVTQATSITTGVTLNSLHGQITTVSQTVAAAAEATFTVTNSNIVGTSDVVVCHVATNNGNGTFQAFVSDVQAGQFDITVANLHASAAGSDTLVINFYVVASAAA